MSGTSYIRTHDEPMTATTQMPPVETSTLVGLFTIKTSPKFKNPNKNLSQWEQKSYERFEADSSDFKRKHGILLSQSGDAIRHRMPPVLQAQLVACNHGTHRARAQITISGDCTCQIAGFPTDGCQPKNRGGIFPPKWMVKIMVPNPMNKWDDLGVLYPYFWFNTHLSFISSFTQRSPTPASRSCL